ncbi:MAG: serine/threonine-protein kinase, partial [Myxococcota bacterium]
MIDRELGSYRIVRKLGVGGMATVYLAEHVLIGRKAAIKVLMPHVSARAELVKRFFDEAKASTAIQHPGIVQIFDFGYYADERAYLTMEHLSGESLGARLRRLGTLEVNDALRVARQCASVLDAAHRLGIVHRDIKPDNIFLIPDPDIEGGERVKLLDFGVAKLLNRSKVRASVTTRVGSRLGTPAYMAPEQCRNSAEIDHRADIYSLGCVMFHMISGKPPFMANNPSEIMARQLCSPPPVLRAAHGGWVPERVAALVERSLRKTVEQRPASMAALCRELSLLNSSALMVESAPCSRKRAVPHLRTKKVPWPPRTERSAASCLGSPVTDSAVGHDKAGFATTLGRAATM